MPKMSPGTPATETTTASAKLNPQQMEAQRIQRSYERSLKEADRMFGDLANTSKPTIGAMSKFTKVIDSLTKAYSKIEYELRTNTQAKRFLEGLTSQGGTSKHYAKYSYLREAGSEYAGILAEKAEDFREKSRASRESSRIQNYFNKLDTERSRISKISSGSGQDLAAMTKKWQAEDITAAEKTRKSEQKFQDWKADFANKSQNNLKQINQRSQTRLAELNKKWAAETIKESTWYKFGVLRQNIAERHLVAQDMSASEAAKRLAILQAAGPAGLAAMSGGGGKKGGGGITGALGTAWGIARAIWKGYRSLNSGITYSLDDREKIAQAARTIGVGTTGLEGILGTSGSLNMTKSLMRLGYPSMGAAAETMGASALPRNMGALGAFTAATSLAQGPNLGGFQSAKDYNQFFGRMGALGIATSDRDFIKLGTLMEKSFTKGAEKALPPKQVFDNMESLLDTIESQGIITSSRELTRMALSGAGAANPAIRNTQALQGALTSWGDLSKNLLGNPMGYTALLGELYNVTGSMTPGAKGWQKFLNKEGVGYKLTGRERKMIEANKVNPWFIMDVLSRAGLSPEVMSNAERHMFGRALGPEGAKTAMGIFSPPGARTWEDAVSYGFHTRGGGKFGTTTPFGGSTPGSPFGIIGTAGTLMSDITLKKKMEDMAAKFSTVTGPTADRLDEIRETSASFNTILKESSHALGAFSAGVNQVNAGLNDLITFLDVKIGHYLP